MKTRYQSLLLALGALALAGTAYAQVPSTNDTSDTTYSNTGMGTGALVQVTPGSYPVGWQNTASGYYALYSNTTGSQNTASGSDALTSNTIGTYNTASGLFALRSNTSGNNNTASGVSALQNNTTGSQNTASGFDALLSNTTGSSNTASGVNALYANTTGSNNTAFGFEALDENTTGFGNAAQGYGALFHNTSGYRNIAIGNDAMYNNTTGSNNTGVGWEAGANLTTGSNNIDIGNQGAAGESGVIRIGTSVPTALQTKTFIAGIYGVSVSGSAVVVNSNGQLGVTVSSERYKTGITPMGSNSGKLQQLRPVTFHLKTDPKGALQYGLIAEEVAKVYPDLVIRDGSGRIDGVRYDEIAPLLLNEVQQQQKAAVAQAAKIAVQDAKIGDLEHQLAELMYLKQELHAAFLTLQAQGKLVAQR